VAAWRVRGIGICRKGEEMKSRALVQRGKGRLALAAGLALLVGLLTGCGDSGRTAAADGQESAVQSQEAQTESSQTADGSAAQTGSSQAADGSAAQTGSSHSADGSGAQTGSGQSADGSGAQTGSGQSADGSGAQTGNAADREAVTVRVGSLKGPTSMGILNLMDKASRGETLDTYEFQMATGADELLPLMVKGEMDIALVPANVAAVLYQKTDGGISVIDVNTLGVLYLVTGSDGIQSIEDLKGKTIYLTGKGTTPEASIRYILDADGLTTEDYTLEFKSEATEVAAVLAQEPEAIGLLPQPFVTAACIQNDSLKVVMDINEEWMRVENELRDGISHGMVTGVTVVRKEFLEENPEAVETFLEEHKASTEAINKDPAAGAALAVEAGIVAKEPIALKAIPECNITCITGEDMKAALREYLNVLEGFNAELIGGKLPGEDFYFCGQ